jgi:transcription factor SPN1
MADEEVYRLRQAMDSAAEADKEAIAEGRPAIEKLKMLNEVVAVLQKYVIQM